MSCTLFVFLPYTITLLYFRYLSKSELLKLFPLRKEAIEDTKPLAKLYRMKPEDCYMIGEITKKFRLDDSTVYLRIRKYSIPTRQIGNYVYVLQKIN